MRFYLSALKEGTLLLCTVTAPGVNANDPWQQGFLILCAPSGALFMALVFCKQLAWHFSAQTIAVLLVELAVGVLAFRHTLS